MKTISVDRQTLIQDAISEGLTALPGAAIEKDVLLSEVLSAVGELGEPEVGLVFCGGTCLSKAYSLIERMSEDIDFKVVIDPSLSRSAKSKKLRALKYSLADMFADMGFGVPPEAVKARNENAYIQIELAYQSAFAPVTSLRSTIQVELNANPPVLPTITLPIKSLLGRLVPTQEQSASIQCVSLEETLAEKVLSFLRRTAESLAGRTRGDYDERLVRHLYDVHAILTRHRDIEFPFAQFGQLVRGDAQQFKNQYPEFVKDPLGELNKSLKALTDDAGRFGQYYESFVGTLVYGEAVSFEQAADTFSKVAQSLLTSMPPPSRAVLPTNEEPDSPAP